MGGIAIVGIGCRFPGGANNTKAFWDMLVAGVDATVDVPEDRWSKRIFYNTDKSIPGKSYTHHGGFLDQIDKFDAGFFGISPREASYLDPQQKILLEVSWEAMEDAGIVPNSMKGKDVGVYIGAFTLDYKVLQYKTENNEEIGAHSATGLMMTMVSNRLSYIYDFRGPSMTVDTACSSSLVALHLACQAINNGECSVAMAGGVNLIFSPEYTISETKGGFLSPDGRSKTYDSSANGYSRGEGAAVVILKPLEKALEDGDYIYGVIRGSAVNQDGHTNGITVPNGQAQEALMKEVYENAGISPSQICYFEAHGTGTPVGDPIEAGAIANALKEGRKDGDKCVIGSVKTNIGHLEAASGMAGLIKSCLILKNKQIPPHIHLKNPNPKIPFDSMCVRVATELEPLVPNGDRTLIGVNSFGFGGTNVHVLLEGFCCEEVKETETKMDISPKPVTIGISARSENALRDAAISLRDFVSDNAENDAITLEGILYTLSKHRSHHEYRLSIAVRSKSELIEYLDAYVNGEDRKGMSYGEMDSEKNKKLVFVYTGMGPIWWAMGRQLFEREEVYRNTIKEIDGYIREYAGWSVIDELMADEDKSRLDQPQYAQPANFALQVALTQLWKSLGISPDAVVGHSVGEVAAAYASGSLDLRQATKVSVERSCVQQKAVGKGTMLAVGISEIEAMEIAQEFKGSISVAAINSEKAVTLSGDKKALEVVNERLQEKGIFSRIMRVNVAYHSFQMDPLKDELLNALCDIKPKKPTTSIYSTVTGELCTGEEYGAEYWWGNVRQSVRFSKAMDNIINDGYCLFVEVGPHPVLKSSILECLSKNNMQGKIVTSIMRNEDEQRILYGTLGNLYVLGYNVDMSKLINYMGRPLKLPLYPWQRERYWLESEESEERRLGKNYHPILGKKLKIPKPTWETDFSLEHSPYLKDHKIQGSVLFPGAGYIEMALAFIKQHLNNEKCIIENVTFSKAIFIKEGKCPAVQFSFDQDSKTFKIYSRYYGENNWTLNASGKICKQVGSRAYDKLDVNKMLEGLGEKVGKEQCYSEFEKMGFEYGFNFQTIESIYKSKGRVLSKICVPDSEFLDESCHNLHPVILDACFQGMIAALATLEEEYSKRLFLPVGLDSMLLLGCPKETMWSYIEINEKGNDYIKGDITLFDEDGNIIGKVGGFNVKDTSLITSDSSSRDNCFYNVDWIPYDKLSQQGFSVDEIKDDEKFSFDKEGLWFVFEDITGLGKSVASKLAQIGQKAISILPGKSFDASNSNSIYINPSEEKDYDALINNVLSDSKIPLKGIVHLWNLNAAENNEINTEIIKEFQELGCISVMNLAKSLERNGLSPRMWILTRGAQNVDGRVIESGVLQAPAWGIGKVIGYQEMPNLFGGLIDLDPFSFDNEVECIFEEMLRIDNEDQIAYRNGERYVLRIVEPDKAYSNLPVEFKPNGAYVITGAFGALGVLTAKWMVERGARRLILMGRTQFPDRKDWMNIDKDSQLGSRIAFVQELEAMGASVHLSCVDVTDENQLHEFMNNYKEEGWPAVIGVIHTAGVVKDKLLREMDLNTLMQVLEPKLLGSWNLHKAFESEPLDFFVLFSSVSSMINVTMGQSNYASGNMFIDALSSYRRAKGLPSLSINWGPWSEVGMASKLNLTDFYEKRGIGSISPIHGMNMMENLMSYDKAQVIVLPAKWQLLCTNFPIRYVPAMIAYLGEKESKADKEKGNENKGGQDLLQDLIECSEDEMNDMLKVQLVGLIAKVFRIDSSKLETNKPLSVFGMDSMMATEIRSRIEMTYKVPVTMVELMQGISIEQLSEKIAVRIKEASASNKKVDEGVTYPHIEHNVKDVLLPFPMTDVQMAYLAGRDRSFVLGGVGTHIYIEVKSLLEIGRLNKAFNSIIKRHPMLRTVFLADGQQKILDKIPEYVIDYNDISKFGEIEQKEKILVARSRLSHRVFDPLKWPLFGISAFKLSEKENYLFISFDMLIVDGTSWQMVGKELFELYENPEMEMPGIKFTFRDYMLAYAEFKKSNAYERDKQYWLSKLDGFPKTPSLPLVKEPKDVAKSHFKRLLKVFGKNEWEKLKTVANKNSISPSALMCTAYAMTLAFWSNQNNMAINVTVFNRYPFNEEVGKLVGDFTSIVVAGLSLKPNSTFWDRARHVQDVLMESLEHKHYDGIEFIRELSKTDSVNKNLVTPVVFTSMLTSAGYGMEGWQKLGTIENAVSQTPQVYLDNQLIELNDELHIIWDYIEELFDERDILNMYSQYTGLIGQLIEEEEVVELQPVSADAELIREYNDTDSDIKMTTLHELFILQAAKTPQNIALIFEGKSVTYGELDEKSDCVAGFLREKNIGKNDIVAVLGKRCIETIVNMFGILKAGAAYVPIDPEYPEERKKYIMENSNCKCILSPDLHLDSSLLTYKGKRPDIKVGVEDTAYVIYTSGSTGRPKGVVITHGAASNTIIDINRKYNVGYDDRIIGLSSLCFDLSVYDVFGALSSGASLVIIPDLRDIKNIADTIRNEKITIWNSVPAIMDMLVENMEDDSGESVSFWQTGGISDMVIGYNDYSSLRTVLLSGDWIPLGLPDKIRAKFVNAELVSLGGATEASIWSIYYPIGELSNNWKSIPYGIPLDNQKFYVLNEEMNLCPVNVHGELYIGGVGLASGYMNDEEKTEKAFMLHPELGRIYRTGDYGVLRQEGYIEFLGRKDQQVKIRGHRIELGEIENCLEKLPGLRDSAVVNRTDGRGTIYLCAYIVSDNELDVEEIKAHLSKELPEYMIPLHYMKVDKIPLSSNGKVDRKALPEPASLESVKKEYISPQNDIEKKIVDICEKLLGISSIGVKDNLYDLGWNSVNMISFASKIQSVFGIFIPFGIMMGKANVRAVADYISAEGVKKANLSVLLNEKCDRNIFAFPAALSFSFAYKQLADRIDDYSIYSFDFTDDADVIKIYTEEILKIQDGGKYVLLGYSGGGNIAFEVAKELMQRGYEVSDIILMDSHYALESSIVKMGDDLRTRFKSTIITVMRNRFPDMAADNTNFDADMDNRIEKYLDMIIERCSAIGTVNANLYYVSAEGDDDYKEELRLQANRWSELTTGSFHNYKGFGQHDDMLFDKNVEKNADILKLVISKLGKELEYRD